MSSGLGYGRIRLIEKIVNLHWDIKDPKLRQYTYNELLFILQELLEEEGRPYQEGNFSALRGHAVFRKFTEYLLYRNLANYDSMILLTSEKGCITGDALLEMPRDLKKYPKGIPLKELEGKGPQWVYSFNTKTQKLELKKCDGIEFVKECDVYEIETLNGMKISATEDHPFLLMDGTYKQLKDIIYTNSKGKPTRDYIQSGKRKLTDRMRIFSRPHILDLNDNRIKIDFNKIDKKNGDTALNHSQIEHRFIMEQLGHIIDKKIVHHKNSKTYDNNICNLHLLENQSKHFSEHNMERFLFKKGNKYGELGVGYSTKKKEKIKVRTKEFKNQCKKKRINFCKNNRDFISNISIEREQNNMNSNHIKNGVRIKSITYKGKQKVYDVVNVRDNHNFIVNGFVVSNTGKSSAAMMLARYWCSLIGIRFNPSRHIAYNNADVMNKIDSLNKFEPIIADESIRFACVAGETLIKTPNGNIPIKELCGKKYFPVYSFNEETKEEEVQIAEKCVQTKVDWVYELETECVEKIQCTKEHKFLTPTGYKTLEELKEGDKVLGVKNKLYKIKSIKKIKKVPVYDIINVQNNNNYIANNFIEHNSSEDWNKKENKELKKKLGQVRTKHLLYILCFPLKLYKLEKTYLESYVNYWIDLFGRGVGACYVKDRNPVLDTWRTKDFRNVGSYTEFTSLNQVRDKLKKHPNFWQIVRFPKPPKWLYTKYLTVREKNVYDDENVLANVSKEDIQRALLILALRDIMKNDINLTMNRIILHINNEFDIKLTKAQIQDIINDSKQLVTKVRETAQY